MSQTDRQTDKATHWKSAIFNVDDNWAKLETLPSFIKTVYRQKEIAPTTQEPHFQVHVVCHQQVRLSKMCSWIQKTKWIPVKGEQHIKNSINYTHKSESAVPGTHQVQQGEKYYQIHELLLEIAKFYERPNPASVADTVGSLAASVSWETITGRMISADPKWANKLSVPALKKAWDWWNFQFIEKVAEYNEATCGAYIIEGPAQTEPLEEGEVCLIED